MIKPYPRGRGWRYIFHLLVAIDQTGNALLGGNPDETISSRCWKDMLRGKPWGLPAVYVIDSLFGVGHCQASADWDNYSKPLRNTYGGYRWDNRQL